MANRVLAVMMLAATVSFRGCSSGSADLGVLGGDSRLETVNQDLVLDTIVSDETLGAIEGNFDLGAMDVFNALKAMDLSLNLGAMQANYDYKFLPDGTEWLYNKDAYLYANGDYFGVYGLDVDRARSGYEESEDHRLDLVGKRITDDVAAQAGTQANQLSAEYLSYFNYYDEAREEYITNATLTTESRYGRHELLLEGSVLKVRMETTTELTLKPGVEIPEALKEKANIVSLEPIKDPTGSSASQDPEETLPTAEEADGEEQKTAPSMMATIRGQVEVYYYLETGTSITKERYESLFNSRLQTPIERMTVQPGDGSSQMCTVVSEKTGETSKELTAIVLDASENLRKLYQGTEVDYGDEEFYDKLISQYPVNGYTEDGYLLYQADVSIYQRYWKDGTNFRYLDHNVSQYDQILSVLGYYTQETYYYAMADIAYYAEDEETMELLQKLPIPVEKELEQLSYLKQKKTVTIEAGTNVEKSRDENVLYYHQNMPNAYIYKGYLVDQEYHLEMKNGEEISQQSEDSEETESSEEPKKTGGPGAVESPEEMENPEETEETAETEETEGPENSSADSDKIHWCRVSEEPTYVYACSAQKSVDGSLDRFYTVSMDVVKKKQISLEGMVDIKAFSERMASSASRGGDRFLTAQQFGQRYDLDMTGEERDAETPQGPSAEGDELADMEQIDAEDQMDERFGDLADLGEGQALGWEDSEPILSRILDRMNDPDLGDDEENGTQGGNAAAAGGPGAAAGPGAEADPDAAADPGAPAGPGGEGGSGQSDSMTALDAKIFQWYLGKQGDLFHGVFSYDDVLYSPMGVFYESPIDNEKGYVIFLDIKEAGELKQMVLRVPYTVDER